MQISDGYHNNINYNIQLTETIWNTFWFDNSLKPLKTSWFWQLHLMTFRTINVLCLFIVWPGLSLNCFQHLLQFSKLFQPMTSWPFSLQSAVSLPLHKAFTLQSTSSSQGMQKILPWWTNPTPIETHSHQHLKHPRQTHTSWLTLLVHKKIWLHMEGTDVHKNMLLLQDERQAQ